MTFATMLGKRGKVFVWRLRREDIPTSADTFRIVLHVTWHERRDLRGRVP